MTTLGKMMLNSRCGLYRELSVFVAHLAEQMTNMHVLAGSSATGGNHR